MSNIFFFFFIFSYIWIDLIIVLKINCPTISCMNIGFDFQSCIKTFHKYFDCVLHKEIYFVFT